MEDHIVRRLQMTLAVGKSDLRFTSDRSVDALLAAALDADPRLLWFLQSYRYEKRGKECRIYFTYRNRSTNLHDVKRAGTVEECLTHLCRAASSHAARLPVCLPKDLLPDTVTDLFHRKYAAAYPNLTAFQALTHSFTGAFCVLEFNFTYRVGGVHHAVWEKQCCEAEQRVADMLFLPDMPPEVKIYLVHNYLALTVTYDLHGDKDTMFTAYGALCLKRCVCHGIADAMRRILERGNVVCQIITGKAGEENHAWNLVKTKAGWHHLDATWDLAAGGSIRYDYFLKGDPLIVPYRQYDRSLYPQMVSGEFLKKEIIEYLRQHRWELLSRGVDKRILGEENG